MNKVLIVDDEAHCRNVLVKHIEEFTDLSLEIETASDITDGLSKINSFLPDIVLLDIRMNEGTGFDLLDKTDSSKFNTIFTTAYNQYAIKAFDYSAIHYLLKPIDKNELLQALHRCALNSLLINNEKVKELKNLFISTETLELNADIKDICFIKAEGSYSNIYLTEGRKIITSKNIGEYESKLPPNFFRVHKSFLVNLIHVKQVNPITSHLLTLCGENIPISRRKKKEFRKSWKKD